MKDKGIGKWLLLVLSCTALYLHAGVSLQVLDVNGKKTKKIQLGRPFFIDVEVTSEGHTSHPKLTTDPAIIANLQGSRSSVYSVNGHKTTSKSYRYAARAQEEGEFLLGPATVMIDGQQENSATQEIMVEVGGSGREEVDEDTKVHLEVKVDKSTVYKGEDVIFTLRLYMVDDGVHIEGIQEPTFEKCTATPLEGPVSGEEVINGVTYRYLEWKSKFYAHNPGSLVIPSISAAVSVESVRHIDMGHSMDFFGMVDSILGTRVERRQLLSNALKINVIDFPASDKKVTACGAFTSLTAKTNLDAAVQGEGIVFTLELVGQGNFAMIQHPPLCLPEGLQYYESNTALHSLGAGISKKDFEYVIQATKPGVYTILPQECTYFDKITHTFKTLLSKPLKLMISASLTSQDAAGQLNQKEQEGIDVSTVLDELGGIEEGSWQDATSRSFSGWLFVWLLLLIFSAYGLLGMYYLLVRHRQKQAPYRSYSIAFDVARKQLQDIKKQQNVQALYGLWVDLFAQRLKLPPNAVTQERIEVALQAAGCNQEMLVQWKEFLNRIVAVSYALDRTESIVDLYQEAAWWLDQLDGKV